MPPVFFSPVFWAAVGAWQLVVFGSLVVFWLDDAALNTLVEDMRAVALAGQRGKPLPVYGALAGSREDLTRRCITMVRLKKTGEPRTRSK